MNKKRILFELYSGMNVCLSRILSKRICIVNAQCYISNKTGITFKFQKQLPLPELYIYIYIYIIERYYCRASIKSKNCMILNTIISY